MKIRNLIITIFGATLITTCTSPKIENNKIPLAPEMYRRPGNYEIDYLVPQAIEFIDNYDPVILWFDEDWDTHAQKLHAYDIAAYFYNNAEGRKEVAINDRFGPHGSEKWQRSKIGDFFTDEFGDMEKEAKQTVHAWEECRGISQSYGFNWQDTEKNVISSKEFIDMFIDIVAHGGNLLLIVNLDGQGALPEIQRMRLYDIGKWLSVNGEGIYSTRPYARQIEGFTAYTRSKDNKYIYAIVKEWPGKELTLESVLDENINQIEVLGSGEHLNWIKTANGIRISIPESLQDKKNRLSKYAWVLKIKVT